MEGGSASTTPMLKVHWPPELSEHVTVVVPTGKNDPDAGAQVTGPQVPLVVGAG